MFKSLGVATAGRTMCVEALGAWLVVGLGLLSIGCDLDDRSMEHEHGSADRDGPPTKPDAGASGSSDAARLDAAVLHDASPADTATRPSDAARWDAAAASDAGPGLRVLVETFFGPTCVLGRCHTTLAPAGGLSLTGRGISVYAALVNAPSSVVPDRMLVVPYDPAASYLMEKLENDAPAAGTRMPPSGAVLPEAQVDRLRAWILAGALDD